MNEPKGCPTPGACSCLSDMEAKDYVAIPRPQYEALVALRPIVSNVAHARAPLNDSVYREARDALAALRAAGIHEGEEK